MEEFLLTSRGSEINVLGGKETKGNREAHPSINCFIEQEDEGHDAQLSFPVGQ